VSETNFCKAAIALMFRLLLSLLVLRLVSFDWLWSLFGRKLVEGREIIAPLDGFTGPPRPAARRTELPEAARGRPAPVIAPHIR
jgi:hypothetical protein